MAASMGALEYELGISEPSYCKLKHFLGSSGSENLSKLQAFLEILSGCQQQHEKILSEFKFLQLMIFKRNGQLRKEKSIQLLKRVQACLKRFHVGTKLYKHTSDLHQEIKSALNEVKANDGACFLPAKQMWVFTLYVLQKYVELLRATASYCVIAYEFILADFIVTAYCIFSCKVLPYIDFPRHLSCQFSTGMLIPQMLLFMGTVSRIWILTKTIREKAIIVYEEIFQLLAHIPQAHSQWVEPPLLPSIGKEEDVMNLTDHPRCLDMSQQKASFDSSKDLKLIHLAIKDSSHCTNSSQNDEEDVGEPICLQDLRVDENSNLRKRKMEDEKSDKHFDKKKKLDNLEESLLHKKFTKKIKKLQKKKLFRDKGLNDLPIVGKKKKQNSMRRDVIVTANEMGEEVCEESSALPQSTTIDNNNTAAQLKSEILLSSRSEEQFVDVLKNKKKNYKKSKSKESHSREGADQVFDSKHLTKMAKGNNAVEKQQGKQKKKKKKQVKKGETLLRPNKCAKMIPKSDISSGKSRSKRKKLKIKRKQ